MGSIGHLQGHPRQGLEMPLNRFIAGHPAAEHQRLRQGFAPHNRIGDILCQPVAKAVADGLQAVTFLLGVDEIGLGKHRAA